MIIIQIVETSEAAKNLVGIEKATVVGVLIFFIVILITAVIFIWRAKVQSEKYVIEHQKDNLIIIQDVVNAVKDVANSINQLSQNNNESRNILTSVNTKIEKVSTIIQERLK